jgi:energy-coupling factor transporter ATP-binding protein EcfA2
MSTDEAILSSPEETPSSNGVRNSHAIDHLSIEGLFGQYNYELPPKYKHEDLSRLFILYGENGSGKTTLLKLVYHALSPEDNRGHRSFIARTKFKRFAIGLHDKTVLEIQRIVKRGGGTLHMALHRDARTIANIELEFDEKAGVPGTDKIPNNERLEEFLGQIRKLRIRLYYLSDDRKHQGEIVTRPRNAEEAHRWAFIRHRLSSTTPEARINLEEELSANIPDDENSSLINAIDRVSDWVQRQVRRGSAKGQESAYTIYSKVVSDIAHSHDAKRENIRAEAENLTKTLHDLEQESERYNAYGLAPKLSAAQELINNLQSAGDTTLPVMCSVIRPHVDGIAARLKALEDIYTTIDRLIQTLNNFYRNKVVSFSVDKGFEIKPIGVKDKDTLNPIQLSSGEKQLFLLLCNTILARKHASLFLIDEPELSLNVKWQRQLVKAILDNSEGSNVQFLLSTHSMELITQHRANVVRLIDKPRSINKREDTEHGGGEG